MSGGALLCRWSSINFNFSLILLLFDIDLFIVRAVKGHESDEEVAQHETINYLLPKVDTNSGW